MATFQESLPSPRQMMILIVIFLITGVFFLGFTVQVLLVPIFGFIVLMMIGAYDAGRRPVKRYLRDDHDQLARQLDALTRAVASSPDIPLDSYVVRKARESRRLLDTIEAQNNPQARAN